MQKNILITGGAGFIGSHVVRLMVTKYPDYQIFNLDALTYAGNLENLKDIENAPNYHFVKANILEATALKEIFEKSEITFEKPLAISQISFDQKSVVEHHILMCGDSAGLIHPLCGNGMGMAIHSAQIASNLIIQFLSQQISREKLEETYQLQWNKAFKSRLQVGRNLAKLFRMNRFSEVSMSLLKFAPMALDPIIRLTHGKPIKEFSRS